MADTLSSVKTLLSINDDEQDALLGKIIDHTQAKLLTYLPSDKEEVPSKLGFVVEEVAVKRYNRVGAEGMRSESLDGHSTKFQDNDFDEFLDIIERLYPIDNGSNRAGSVTFY